MEPWENIASRQAGAITAAQLRGAGLSSQQRRQLVRHGSLRLASHTVYVIAGAPASWELGLQCALLRAGPEGFVYRRSAARLWGLDGFVDCPPGEFEVAVPADRMAGGRGLHRLRALSPRDVGSLAGMAVTSPARTLVDLGTTSGEDLVERALECGLRRRLLSVADARAAAFVDGRRGAARLRAVLLRRPDGAPATESDAETLFLQVARRCGLPEPRRQVPSLLGGARLRMDFAWPASRLAVEIDGAATHAGADALGRDLRRQNRLVVAGWLVLRFTWSDVAIYPDQVAEVLLEAWTMRAPLAGA